MSKRLYIHTSHLLLLFLACLLLSHLQAENLITLINQTSEIATIKLLWNDNEYTKIALKGSSTITLDKDCACSEIRAKINGNKLCKRNKKTKKGQYIFMLCTIYGEYRFKRVIPDQ